MPVVARINLLIRRARGPKKRELVTRLGESSTFPDSLGRKLKLWHDQGTVREVAKPNSLTVPDYYSRPVTATSPGCSMLNFRENSRFSPGFSVTRQTSFPSSSRVTSLGLDKVPISLSWGVSNFTT